MSKINIKFLIGRFSIFHNGHAELLRKAADTAELLVVMIGSSGQARNLKNPFSFEERRDMISGWAKDHIKNYEQRLLILPLYDHPYNDQEWIEEVQNNVAQAFNYFNHTKLTATAVLTGADRDSSTWYLNAFGDLFKLDLVAETQAGLSLNATALREMLFNNNWFNTIADIKTAVPNNVLNFIVKFICSQAGNDLIDEGEFVKKYKEAWKAAPYAPTFVTTDACVIQSGHILVNVRDNFPGVGLWALPGGFLEQNEKLIDGCVRELVEETKIGLSMSQLYGSIKTKELFDNPDRSFRGRTITTCFLFKLDDTKPLPKVKAQKGEVQKVMWVPINEALSKTDMWFEDHLELVKWGVSQAR